jgi:phosphatidylglycerophosphatase A
MSDTLEPQNPTEKKTVSFFTKLIATGFYSGYSPVAPGTAGSLVGVAIYLIPGFENSLSMPIITIAAFFIGVLISNQMEKQLGDDPAPVVIDEIVGMWISLLFLPRQLLFVFTAFLLFRIFDIVKPQPARYIERFKNGWGIMLDDVVAGLYSNIAVRILILIFPSIS